MFKNAFLKVRIFEGMVRDSCQAALLSKMKEFRERQSKSWRKQLKEEKQIPRCWSRLGAQWSLGLLADTQEIWVFLRDRLLSLSSLCSQSWGVITYVLLRTFSAMVDSIAEVQPMWEVDASLQRHSSSPSPTTILNEQPTPPKKNNPNWPSFNPH